MNLSTDASELHTAECLIAMDVQLFLFAAKLNTMMYTSVCRFNQHLYWIVSGWSSTHLSLLNFVATGQSAVLQYKARWTLNSHCHSTPLRSKEGIIRFSPAASILVPLYESLFFLRSYFMVSHDIWPAPVAHAVGTAP